MSFQNTFSKFCNNLHSNLVIFKLYVDKNADYGDSLFTFQSGDIQIGLIKKVIILILVIYIPIW